MGKQSRTKRERRQQAHKPLQPPPEALASLDRITTEDRLWFEAHPRAEERIRPPAPGEFWPINSATVAYVIVHQVQPGLRLRLPICRIAKSETERVQ